jgi:hypothetical protein
VVFNLRSTVLSHHVRMPDEYNLTLRQLNRARGDLYAMADELETVKLMLRRLPSRAYLSRTLWMVTWTRC